MHDLVAIPEEVWGVQWLKHFEYNNLDEHAGSNSKVYNKTIPYLKSSNRNLYFTIF